VPEVAVAPSVAPDRRDRLGVPGAGGSKAEGQHRSRVTRLSEGTGSVYRVTGPGDVPPEILDRLRPVCLGLPESYEEPAWVGTRWRIRKRTFAHVLTVDPDRHVAHARATATDHPICVLTFRSPGDEIDGLVTSGHRSSSRAGATDVVGMVLDGVSTGKRSPSSSPRATASSRRRGWPFWSNRRIAKSSSSNVPGAGHTRRGVRDAENEDAVGASGVTCPAPTIRPCTDA
jgi:hypothetical protein